jgi:hypothetical protein
VVRSRLELPLVEVMVPQHHPLGIDELIDELIIQPAQAAV